jgi:hypothetical protein
LFVFDATATGKSGHSWQNGNLDARLINEAKIASIRLAVKIKRRERSRRLRAGRRKSIA